MATEERRKPSQAQHWSLSWQTNRMLANLRDTFSNRHHSKDFDFARSDYLRARLIVVSIVFTLLAPLWILVDYWLLPRQLLEAVALGRILLMSTLIGVVWAAFHFRNQLNMLLHSLAILLLAPSLFYLGLTLFSGQTLASLVGYSFIPLLLVAFLSVFPLTLMESLGIGLTILVIQVVSFSVTGRLNTPYAWQDLWLLSSLLFVALWANNSQVTTLLRLYRQASMDSLTGLLNRGVLVQQMEQLCQQRKQAKANHQQVPPLCLLMLDLDRFKRVNDTYGHSVGDQILQVFAQILRTELRKNDLIARYGGEEFMAVLPNTSKAEACQVADRILNACRQACVEAHDGQGVQFTTSIGVTQIRMDDSLDTAFNRVDKRLYAAKFRGRDRYIDADLETADPLS